LTQKAAIENCAFTDVQSSGNFRRWSTGLEGVFVLQPKIFSDVRGFFLESYNKQHLAALGLPSDFVQDNHSRSARGTLRGFHYQLRHPQGKLCRVVVGEVLDVAVDVRVGSPTFGQWVSLVLSAENQRQVYVPGGFAHAFLALSEHAEFLYKCTELYHPEDEHGIIWNDPKLKIEWPIDDPLLSAKDQKFTSISELGPEKLPKYQPK
jgi:dTDP-4-dehydrorhamnose 3,5-epimerase